MSRTILIALMTIIPCWSVYAQGQPQTANQEIATILGQIRNRAALKLSPTTVQNTVDASEYEIQKLTNVTIAASVTQDAANAIIAEQIKTDKNFKSPKFSFTNQSMDGTIEYSGTLAIPIFGPVDVKAALHAQLATAVEVVTTGPTAEFRVSFAVSALDVKSLQFAKDGVAPPNFVNDAAQAVINGVLTPAQTLLNHVELRLPTTVAAEIQLKANQQSGLTVTYDPAKLNVGFQITSAAHLMDGGRLIAVAQEGGTLKNVPGKPTNIAFSILRNDFRGLLAGNSITWIEQGQLSAYVDRSFLQRLISKTLGVGPVCIHAKLNDMPVPFATKLKLPPVDSIDCTPTTDCTPRTDCTPATDCSQSRDCSACILHNPFGGCTLRGNDPTCEAAKVASKGTCEANKAAQKASCEAQKSAKKAACEAGKTAEKAACEGLKESYKRFRATGADYANVDSKDLHLSGIGNVCVSSVAFDPKTLSLTGKLQTDAFARASGHIEFTPLNVAGHLTCFAPFNKQLDLSAQVPAQSVDINTTAKFADDTAQVAIEAYFSNPIHIHFPFSVVAANLASDPNFTIFCPVPSAAMRLRASTPDNWWPREARGDIEHDLPDVRFDLDLIKKPIAVGDLRLTGRLQSNKVGIGAILTIAGRKPSG
jgi:hypothetical protein